MGLIALWGCGRAPELKSSASTPPPPSLASLEVRRGPEAPRAPAAPRSPLSVPEGAVGPATRTVAELVRAFQAEPEAAARGELAGELWEVNTADAIAALQQFYLAERDGDVRTDLLAGINDEPKAETREARYRFLLAAVAPGQPKEARELALQFLGEFEDVRAVAALQVLAGDGDPEIREAAAELLEARRAAER